MRLTLRITGVWGSGVGGTGQTAQEKKQLEDLSELVMFHLGSRKAEEPGAPEEAERTFQAGGAAKPKRALRNKRPEGM